MRGQRSGWRSRGEWLRRHSLVRRLRLRPRQPQTRAASGPALGVLRPLCEELADGLGLFAQDTQARTGAEASPKGNAESRGRAPRGAPAGDPAGHLRRSGDGPVREAGHGVRRSAPAPVGALLPSFFHQAELGMVRRATRHGEGERMPAAPPLTCDPRAQTLSRHKAGARFVLSKRPSG